MEIQVDHLRSLIYCESMIEKLFPISMFIAGAFFAWVATISVMEEFGQKSMPVQGDASENRVTYDYSPNPVVFRGEVTCRYPQVVSVDYDGRQIGLQLNKPETNPIITTYTDLASEYPVARSIDVTQTISEVQLAKIYEDESKVVLLEGLNGPYETIHTVFFDQGISIYSKHLSIFGITFTASTGIGTCK